MTARCPVHNVELESATTHDIGMVCPFCEAEREAQRGDA